MQTILGAGGAIGIEVAKALNEFTNEIRLVSRNPKKVNPDDELMKADLLNAEEVMRAVEGSSVVYLTAGLPYSSKVWEENWPKIIINVIEACEKYHASLVFFDNIYMYDPGFMNHMTEGTPVNPVSRKGRVRAALNKLIMDEVNKGKLKALIARCADYYGPGETSSSMLTQMVINPLKTGKTANWVGPINYKHSFTYTPDAGKATALLGNTPGAYNQVWHLPTAADPFTGKGWIEAIAIELGVKPKYTSIPKYMIQILGLFTPIMKEVVEMYYQYNRDYVFDSSKFENRFGIKATPYKVGIREILKSEK